MLTIIGGELKGSRLLTPKGKEFRPTLGKTREALFSVITSRFQLSEYTCYDLFAGSGALGIEALSRGVVAANFVEKNKQNYQLLKNNIKQLSIESRCRVYHEDAIRWISRINWVNPLNMFFIDPPYQTELAQGMVDQLALASQHLQNSLVVVESHKTKQLSIPGSMVLFQQKVYGSTKIEFFEISNRGTS